MKKILSVILAAAMILGCLPVLSFAADRPVELVVANIQKWNGSSIEAETIDSASPGDIIVLTIGIKNNSGEAMEVLGMETAILFDGDVFAKENIFGKGFYTTNGTTVAEEYLSWSLAVGGSSEKNSAVIGMGGSSGHDLAPGEAMTVLKIALSVKEDAPAGETVLGFNPEKSHGVSVTGDGNKDDFVVADRSSKSINIIAPASVLESAEIDVSSIEVDGVNEKTAQLTALNDKDKAVAVTWSVEPDDGNVTVDENTGKVTVSAKAKAGTYTFTAIPDGTNVTGDSKTVALTVARSASKAAELEITGGASIAVPEKDAALNKQTYTASAKDQFGEDFTADVTWSMEPADIRGVAIDAESGELSVDSTAKTGKITVKATAGTVSAAKEVVINRADSVATAVEITGSDAINVPELSAGEAVVAFTATVTDQFDDEMGADIVWSMEPASVQGVTMDASGNLKVDSTAKTGKITVKATAGTVSAAKEVTINRADSVAAAIEITGSDTIAVPEKGAAESQQTYTAKVKDQFGEDFTADVTWSIEPASVEGVTIDASGTLKADSTAKTGKITVKAAAGTVSAAKEVVINRADSVATAVEITGSDVINVPELSAGEAAVPFTATVTDQFGEDFDTTVTWSMEPANAQGVTIDASGNLKVDSTAKTGKITVKATAGTVSAAKEVTINRADSVAAAIEITGSDTIAVPEKGAAESQQTYTAKVKDQFGEDFDTTVTWSMEPASVQGVTMDASGTLKVNNTAKVDTITVKATAGEASGTVTVTVTREEPKAAEVTISESSQAGGITVPADDSVASVTFEATVTDQYGDEMEAPQIKWSVEPETEGVSIDENGKLTVTRAAKDGVTEQGTAVKVKATVDGVTKEYEITIKREPAEASEIKLYSGEDLIGETDVRSIPAEGEETYAYTAKVYNQYGEEMTSTVTWTFETADSSVTFSEGVLTVKAGAENDSTYTLTAQTGSVSVKTTVTLQNIQITWPTVTVKENPRYGDTWEEIVKIGADGSAAIIGEKVEGAFTLKETGMPDVGDAEYTIVFNSNDGKYSVEKVYTGVTVAPKAITLVWSNMALTYNGTEQAPVAATSDLVGSDAGTVTITVAGGKTNAGTVYTATASIDSAKYTIQNPIVSFSIEAAEIAVAWTNTELTYNGTEQAPAATVSGTFGSDEADVTVTGGRTAAGEGYTAAATINNTNYKLTNDTVTFSIAKLTVKVSGLTAEDKEYDGTVNAVIDASAAVIEGAVAGDEITVTAKGEFESKTAESGKTVAVTELTLEGAAKDNYEIAEDSQTETTASISRKTVTVSGITANNKTVDQNTNATLNFANAVIEGRIAGDDLSVTATGTFEDSEVGTGKKVIITDIEFTGADKDNYELASEGNQTETTANITRKSTGGGASGGPVATYYNISTGSTANGYITLSKGAETAGASITVTAVPNSGYKVGDVTVTTAAGGKVTVSAGAANTFTFTMPAANVTVTVTFIGENEESKAPEGTAGKFVDVESGSYYADAVDWAVEKGVTTGVTATTFVPDGSCTRAQTVTFLWRAAGSPEPTSTTSQFADVDANAYYYKAVLWAVETGVTLGTGATTFSPEQTVTRAQVVTFLYRCSGDTAGTDNGFVDVSADAYFAAPVTWAALKAITNGTSATTFSPDNSCLRAQIVTFLYRYYNK